MLLLFETCNSSFQKRGYSLQKTIAEKLNKFYVNVGSNLASKIPQNNNDYKSYLPDNTTLFDEQELTEQELKEAVASLKPNKSPECDSIHVNVIKAIYDLFSIFFINP